MTHKPITLLGEALELGRLRKESKDYHKRICGQKTNVVEKRRLARIYELEKLFPDDDYDDQNI